MNREEVIALAKSKGLQAKPCALESMMAVNVGKAEDPNERMRLTESGQVLVVDERHEKSSYTGTFVSNLSSPRRSTQDRIQSVLRRQTR
jgi:hypothetical protein